MKIIKLLNYYFLHDEDEAATISDYLIFYGFNLGFTLLAIILFIKLLGGF